MKILHFSDLHADGRNLDEVKKCGDYILVKAYEESPDLIIFSGDAFESCEVRLDSSPAKYVFQLFSGLADIAPVSAIIGTPSHDGRAIEVLNYVKGRYPIHVTADFPEQIFLVDGGFYIEEDLLDGFEPKPMAIISAFPAPTKKWFKSDDTIQKDEAAIAQGITAMMMDFGARAEQYACPHILNAHWNVTGAFVSGTQTLTGVDIEVSKDQMKLGNFHLGCLGHIHKAQDLGENIFFAGSTQNNTWGEMDAKGFYIHESYTHLVDGTRIEESTFVKTPTRPMIDLDFDCTGGGLGDLDVVNIAVGAYKKDDYQGAKVRLTLKVFVDEVEKLDLPGIKSFFESVNADLDLQLIRMPRENVRSKRILELDGLYDKIQENASILNEAIPQGIQAKAERLEAGDKDALLAEVRGL